MATNNTVAGTLMAAIFNTDEDILFSIALFEATKYSQVSTPILYLHPGKYKYRGVGETIELIRYINYIK